DHLSLFCLIDGDGISGAFPLDILPAESIGYLKKLIKAEQAPVFDDIPVSELTLWLVKIPEDKEDYPVTVDALDAKTD
ncbi:hypothetical protein BGZ58_008849, partial [Dissophora ornata]